jgi:hypothetical protein
MTEVEFNKLVNYLWQHRSEYFNDEVEFDYPDYGGFPRAGKYSTDAVDAIQNVLFGDKPGSKREFVSELRYNLGRYSELKSERKSNRKVK